MRHKPPLRRPAGFAMIVAILALLVLGALTAYLANIFANRNQALAYDTQGTQALQAARAGIEWGIFHSLRNDRCLSENFPLAGAGLAQFTVTVTCVRTAVAEDGVAFNVDTFNANACNQPTAAGACPNPAPATGYVERLMTSVVSTL